MQMDAAAQGRLRSALGMEALPAETGIAMLRQALIQSACHVAVLHGDGRRLLELLRQSPEIPPAPKQDAPESKAAGPDDALVLEVERALRGLVATHLKLRPEALERDIPLSKFGFDSITLTSFGQTLNQAYGLQLSPTVFFEAPTIGALAEYLVREHRTVLSGAVGATAQNDPAVRLVTGPAEPLRERPRGRQMFRANGSTSAPSPLATEPIAVIGMSGCFPKAPDIDSFWANLQSGRECIGELPPNRWGKQRPPQFGTQG